MRFLYIEDEPDQIVLIRAALENAGHIVLIAEDEFAGLQMARQENPDVILLDIRLKNMNGLAVAVQIRAVPHLRQTLLLAVTAGTISSAKHVLAAGCDGYLEKPIRPLELMSRLQPYLDGRRDRLNRDELLHYTRENSEQFVSQLMDRIEALQYRLTELHRVQESLIRSERLAATGRLALAVAHEINNPMQAIQGALELIGSAILKDDARRGYLEIALKETQRVSASMHRMLNVYTPEAEQFVEVDLAALVRDALALVSRTATDAGLQIEAPAEDLSMTVQASYAQLHQLVLNLLLNALDAMPSGGSLQIVLEAAGNEVVLSVADTGSGLLPDARPFEPFYTTKPHGHGLGLYICWLIAEANHAVISASNNPSGGATFTLRLPRP